MEDYNTGTLPHKKYYDLDLYEKKRALKAAKSGKNLVRASVHPGCRRKIPSVWSIARRNDCLTLRLACTCSLVCQEAEKAHFNDEADVAARRQREALAAQQERLREAYNELKYTAPDKVEAMRDQEMTRMQMNLAYRTGAVSSVLLFCNWNSKKFALMGKQVPEVLRSCLLSLAICLSGVPCAALHILNL